MASWWMYVPIFFNLVWSPPTALRFIHWLVARFVSFNGVYCPVALSALLCWKQLSAPFLTKVDEICGRLKELKCLLEKTKQAISWKMLKYSVELRETAESGDNCLWVCRYKWPLSHYMYPFNPVVNNKLQTEPNKFFKFSYSLKFPLQDKTLPGGTDDFLTVEDEKQKKLIVKLQNLWSAL